MKRKPQLRPKRAKAQAPRPGSQAEKIIQAFDAGAQSVAEMLTKTGCKRETIWRTLQRWRPDWKQQLWEPAP